MPVVGRCGALAVHRGLFEDRVTVGRARLPWVALRLGGGLPRPRGTWRVCARAPPGAVRIVIDELAPPRLGWHASPGWSPGASLPRVPEMVGATDARPWPRRWSRTSARTR